MELRVRLELFNNTGSSYFDVVLGADDIRGSGRQDLEVTREGSRAKVLLQQVLPSYDPFCHTRNERTSGDTNSRQFEEGGN